MSSALAHERWLAYDAHVNSCWYCAGGDGFDLCSFGRQLWWDWQDAEHDADRKAYG